MKKLLAVMVVGLLIAADAPKSDQGAKTDKLDGTWTATAMVMGGQPAPDELVKTFKLTFKGDKINVEVTGAKHEASFKTDASKKPASIDITPTDGPEKGKTMKGIYELKGDTLKIAFIDGEGDRPTEFASKAETKMMMFTLKRDTK